MKLQLTRAEITVESKEEKKSHCKQEGRVETYRENQLAFKQAAASQSSKKGCDEGLILES